MATTTITVNADTGNIWQAGTYANIDEGFDSLNDSDYIQTGVDNDAGFFNLEDMPADLDEVTGITIRLRGLRTVFKGDPCDLHSVQIFQQNASTELTTEVVQNLSVSATTYEVTPTLNGAVDRTTWQNAKIRFLSTGDDGFARITAVEFDITYTEASGTTYNETGSGGVECAGVADDGLTTTTITVNGNGGSTFDSGSYTDIDDGFPANDSTYVEVDNDTTIFFDLEEIADLGTVAGVTARIRIKCEDDGSHDMELESVSIVESDGTTDIATMVAGTYDDLTFTTHEFPLSIVGATDKTTWDDALVKIVFDGDDTYVRISALEFDVRYVESDPQTFNETATGGIECGSSATVEVSQPICNTLRPDRNITSTWTNNSFTLVDDVVTNPTNGDLSVASTTTPNQSQVWGLSNLYDAFSYVDDLTVNVNSLNSGTAKTLNVRLYINESWTTFESVTTGSGTNHSWDSATFTGSWTQSDFDDLQIEIKTPSTIDTIEVDAVYCSVCGNADPSTRITNGGMNTDGQADVIISHNITGGVTTTGEADLFIIRNISTSGGIQSASEATITGKYNISTSGGIESAAEAIVKDTLVMTGGVKSGSESQPSYTSNITTTGGIECGSSATVEFIGPLQAYGSMSVWLEADHTTFSNDESVDSWLDLSNNETVSSSGSNRPTLKTNIINGKPTIRFDGTDDYLDLNNSGIIPATGNFTIVAIVDFTDESTDNQVLFSQYNTSDSNRGLIYNANKVFQLWSNGSVNNGVPVDADPHLYVWTRSGNNFTLHIDGGLADSDTATTTFLQTGNLIGARGNHATTYNDSPTEFSGMDLTLFALYPSALSGSTRRQLETELITKYGLEIGGVNCGSSATVQYIQNAGGMNASGEADVAMIYSLTTNGGVETSGTSEIDSSFYPTGSVECGSSADIGISLTAIGGMECGGTAPTESILILNGGPTVFHNGYQYRKQATISATTTALTDFVIPVSVTLANVESVFGFDITFEDEDQNTLSHQIESFDSETGELKAWVETTTTTSGSTLFCFYGKENQTDSQTANTWTSFNNVYHLKEFGQGLANEYKDATNNNHGTGGTSNSSPAIQTDGRLANGQNFDGGDFITTTADPISDSDDVTVSAWIRISEANTKRFVFTRGERNIGDGEGWSICLGHNEDGKVYSAVQTTNSDWTETEAIGTTTITHDVWHHIAMVWTSGTSLKVYLDGVLETTTTANVASTTFVPTTRGNSIGRRDNQNYFIGDIDEIRISTDAKTDEWILAESQFTDLVEWSTEQTAINVNSETIISIIDNVTTSGGVVCGSSAPISFNDKIETSGGVESGGSTTVQRITADVANGGVECGSSATVSIVYSEQSSGSVRTGSEAGISYLATITPTGGCVVSGESSATFTDDFITSGGTECGSSAEIEFIYSISITGGVETGNESTISRITTDVTTGGIEATGTSSTHVLFNLDTDGGVETNGDSDHHRTFTNVAGGGVETGTTSPIQLIVNHLASAGIEVGSDSPESFIYPIQTTGGVVTNGTSSVSESQLNGAGNIAIGGESTLTVINNPTGLKGGVSVPSRMTGNVTTPNRLGGNVTLPNRLSGSVR